MPDTELAAQEEILYSAANFDYSDDSDLDDLEPDEAEKERTASARRARDAKGNRAERVPGDTVASDPPRPTRISPTTHSATERDQTNVGVQSKAAPLSAEVGNPQSRPSWLAYASRRTPRLQPVLLAPLTPTTLCP